MNQQQIIKNEAQRYALIGLLFGLLFPIAATVIRVSSTGLPFNLSSLITVQSTDPLLWIIDTAPIILGYIALLAGHRQDESRQRELELIQKEKDLVEIQNTLEQRVAERTKELEGQSTRLRVAAEIAKDAASSQNLSELLERAGNLIQDRFGFYHTGFFLIDVNKDYAVLTSSPTEAGRKMISDGHKLRVGYTGVVGRVASTGEARIVLDTTADAGYFNNPHLPNTKSEMALPLKVESNIIGVLDVQSDQLQAFNNNDVIVVQILADQLAIAIERARLLQQVEQSLKDLERVYGRTTRESWSSLAKSGLLKNAGYNFDNVRIRPINESPLLGQKAMQSGVKISETADSKQDSIAIPIKLRGQSIGAITVKLRDGHKQTTVKTIEQAAERLASTLEGARLFEEARQRANYEQTVSQVTTAISSAAKFDDILRTAIEEIGKSLGDSEVSIQIIENTE
ncbi:MAG TPA: GAF domain-containing protein [Anaerolineales bacterium]|nr:GAF domain-containing protein [Anaerolineales bacterium]